jgi:hypothetical protein
MSDIKQCSWCHKKLNVSNFLRKNWKNTGEIREWKICTTCNIKKMKVKVENINKEYNITYNYIAPFNNEQEPIRHNSD